MKCGNTGDIIYKEVVVIGNGPSGIALSYMLSGNLPYLISDSHPDEMLSARLRPAVGKCLVNQDLEQLAFGLEGRSTNPISLLLDALLHPYADMGLEMDPLAEFRNTGKEIDHIVLGKGPPGGSWHKMDPHILTLSLGSWMALPGLPFHSRDSGEKRAFAYNVAKYYVQYVHQMRLAKYMKNNAVVTSVTAMKRDTCQTGIYNRCKSISEESWTKRLESDLSETEECIDERRPCFISNAINCFTSKLHRNNKSVRCKRPREQFSDQSPTRQIDSKQSRRDKVRSISFCCDSNDICDRLFSSSFSETTYLNPSNNNTLRNSYSLDFGRSVSVPYSFKHNPTFCDSTTANWVVSTYDTETGEKTTYSCRYLVLANGASDLPNRLEISRRRNDPSWLVHDLRSLELQLDEYMKGKDPENVDPVLILGAGLSAADAVIATRARNIPVVHVFRNKSADLNRQLPENMYPEYHKVHQMMKDGGSTYPFYSAYPEYTLTDIDDTSRTVILTSKTDEQIKINVSFAAILIGSRPDLTFLPSNSKFGVKKELPIDCKTNTIDINKSTHLVNGYDNLFAVGPLAGDNFVRFIPGGALAVVSELYRRRNTSK